MDRDVTREQQFMLVTVDKPDAGLVREARAILTAHMRDASGLCVGCYEFACVISTFPCSQVRWALKVAVRCAEGGRS